MLLIALTLIINFMASRIGVDIGGTFTDFIVYDEAGNKVIIDKILN